MSVSRLEERQKHPEEDLAHLVASLENEPCPRERVVRTWGRKRLFR